MFFSFIVSFEGSEAMKDTEFAIRPLTPPPEALGTLAAVAGVCLSLPTCRCSRACAECGPPRLDEVEAQFGTGVFRRRRFVERVLGA